jgi:hypothetical protein
MEKLKKYIFNGCLFTRMYKLTLVICSIVSQPLQIIYGYISIMKSLDLENEDDKKKLKELLNKTIVQVDRITEMVKDMQMTKTLKERENVVIKILNKTPITKFKF